MGRGGDAALAAPAGRRQGERCLDSKGPTQRPRPPEGGVFRATDSGMAGLQGVWAGLEQWGEGAGGGNWWWAWCSQELVQEMPQSPASLVPCPMPGDRHGDGSDRVLDSGVNP